MYPSTDELVRIYEARQAAVFRLGQQTSISIEDLTGLDRLGRVIVADELWHLCSADAREKLLSDGHPHVRSTARLSAEDEDKLSAATIHQLMRQSKMTNLDSIVLNALKS